MMHKSCSINYGHLADLQKTLPTTDLNKKKLSFDKISHHDFFFSFQSVLVSSGITCTYIRIIIHSTAYHHLQITWLSYFGSENQGLPLLSWLVAC